MQGICFCFLVEEAAAQISIMPVCDACRLAFTEKVSSPPFYCTGMYECEGWMAAENRNHKKCF